MRKLTAVLGLLMLAGCAVPKYHRSGTEQAQFNRDFCACLRDVGVLPDVAWLSAQVQMRDQCMESKGYIREW